MKFSDLHKKLHKKLLLEAHEGFAKSLGASQNPVQRVGLNLGHKINLTFVT